MKKILIIYIACFSFLLFIVPPFNSKASTLNNKEEKLIVKLSDHAKKYNVDGLINELGGKVNKEFTHMNAISVSLPIGFRDKLSKSEWVESVETDYTVHADGQTIDWGIKSVNAQYSWKSNFTGQGIKVAVLDTGISDHNDLTISGGASFVSYTSSYIDDNGHGTHVAGIIGARNNKIGVVGVAPDSSIYAVKVLDYNGSGYISDIISGIDWCISNKMDVINLSFSTSQDSQLLHDIIDTAYSNGLLIVASSGNNGTQDGNGDTIQYPARYSSVIAVSAIDRSNVRAPFSATGDKLEVSAPGVQIYSTYLNNSYAYMNGTSMATAFVTGDIALIKQATPGIDNLSLRNKLDQQVIDLGSAGHDTLYGYGLIQAP